MLRSGRAISKRQSGSTPQVLGLKVGFRVGPDMIFLHTPSSTDLLNFIESTKRISGIQALDHIGFKITPAELKRIEKGLKEYRVKIESRRGRNEIYILDSNGYQIEYYCD